MSPRRVLAVLAAAALVAACGGSRPQPAAPATSAPTTLAPTTIAPTTPAPTTAAPTSTTTTTVAPTTTTTRPTPSTTAPAAPTTTAPAAAALLRPGDSGPAVLALQRRLSALGYWLGTADGHFGDSTEQAVYAIQKAGGVTPDGVVGPLTAAVVARGPVPAPRSASGHVIEINLGTQLLLVVDGGKVDAVLNTSTGGGYTYTSGGVTAVARTPVGRFSIFRQVNGMVVSPLGQLWRPKFFYSGYAIHGSPSVPPRPVSHGCVRVSNEAIDWAWATGVMAIGTPVWVY